jgi:CheY-like chemotaxis protein
MEVAWVADQQSIPAGKVVVVVSNATMRSALGEFLHEAGYAVTLAENLREAEPFIDAAAGPVVLVLGDAQGADRTKLHVFTVVAATAMTQHLHVYVNATPEHVRVPAPGETRATADDLPGDKPDVLHSQLAVVATASTTA